MAYCPNDDLKRLTDDEMIDLDDAELLDDAEILEDDELLDDDIELEEDEESVEEQEELPKEDIRAKVNQKVIKGGMKLNVDVTVVLDVTGSMEPMIDSLKSNVLSFRTLVYDKLNEKLESKRKDRSLNKMRVRVVAFRDYNYDWEAALPEHGPMLMSEFCDLEDEVECAQLQAFVNKLEATGGEDDPESALEAIHYAINSKWDFSEGIKHRHVIMVFTDAPALKLDDPRNATNEHYPKDADMPKSLAKLQAEYYDQKLIDQDAQRILLFVPKDDETWSDIAKWNGVVINNVVPDDGLREQDIDAIMSALSGSLK